MAEVEVFKSKTDIFTRKLEIINEFFGKEEEATFNELFNYVKSKVSGALVSTASETLINDTTLAIIASAIKSVQEERQAEGKAKSLRELRSRLEELEKNLKEKSSVVDELSKRETLSEEEARTKILLEGEIQTLKDEISAVKKEIDELKALLDQHVSNKVKPFVGGALSAIVEVEKRRKEMGVEYLSDIVPEEYEGVSPEEILSSPEDPAVQAELEVTIDEILDKFLSEVDEREREIYECMLSVFQLSHVWYDQVGNKIDLDKFYRAVQKCLRYEKSSELTLNRDDFEKYWEKIKPVLRQILTETIAAKGITPVKLRPTTKVHGTT